MRRKKLSPIITFIILIVFTILLSGLLHFLGVQAEYSTVNPVNNELTNNVIEVENLLSGSGLKYIVTNAVSDFVGFAPLSMLIIILMGIGILEKTGFMRTFFTLLTQKSKKNSLTFMLILFSILLSITGDITFVIMLPIGALLFKYGRRNPLGGIIAAFAGVSIGYGINIFLSVTDISLLSLTLNAAKLLDSSYKIGIYFSIIVMSAVLIGMSFMFTSITEKNIMPKLGKYEFSEEDANFRVTNRELRGLIVGLSAGTIYLLIIIYMIIPNLPLSGALLDMNATRYIDMLFGTNSLFSRGFVFIVTMLFVIIGLLYGIITKNIKNSKDFTTSIAYSLNGIGNIIVLIFFASLFISVFKKSNIGFVVVGTLVTLLGKIGFTGVGLILALFVVTIISNIFVPSQISKWTMLSGTVVPIFMNASLSPEFAQIIFAAGNSVTNALTPLLAYFVVYLAFLEKYNQGDIITLKDGIKYMLPYSLSMLAIWFIVLIGWYIVGIPLGVNSLPGVTYVS